MKNKATFNSVGKVSSELLYSEKAPTVMKTTIPSEFRTNRMQDKNLKRALFLFKKIANSAFYSKPMFGSEITTIKINLNGLSVVYFRNTFNGIEVSFKVDQIKCEENTLISFMCVLKMINVLIRLTQGGVFSDTFSVLSDVDTGLKILHSVVTQIEEHKKSPILELNISDGTSITNINPSIKKIAS